MEFLRRNTWLAAMALAPRHQAAPEGCNPDGRRVTFRRYQILLERLAFSNRLLLVSFIHLLTDQPTQKLGGDSFPRVAAQSLWSGDICSGRSWGFIGDISRHRDCLLDDLRRAVKPFLRKLALANNPIPCLPKSLPPRRVTSRVTHLVRTIFPIPA